MKQVLQQRPLSLTSSTVCPTDIRDKCDEARLRLAFENTRKKISASPRAVLLNHWKTAWITQAPLIPWSSIWWSTQFIQLLPLAVSALLEDAGIDTHMFTWSRRLYCLSGGSRKEIETPCGMYWWSDNNFRSWSAFQVALISPTNDRGCVRKAGGP